MLKFKSFIFLTKFLLFCYFKKICELQRGSFFGEEDIIENKKTRSFKVVCNSSTGGELYSIRREIFERIFMKHFSIE